MYNEPQYPHKTLESRINDFVPDPRYRHDPFILETIREALAAANEGNFGVGAVVVDPHGDIVQRGHNHVFYPHFRSDIHAEMDAMDKFEDRFPQVDCMRDYTLFTSLEPCPMCLTRLITSGVGKVFHAAQDVESGMALEKLTEVWRDLAKFQCFSPADCSPELKEISHEIFLVTANRNTEKLLARRMG